MKSYEEHSGQPKLLTSSPEGVAGRFCASVLIKEYREHENVEAILIHMNALDDETYRRILSPIDPDTPYMKAIADQTFSEAEIETLRRFHDETMEGSTFKSWPAPQISTDEVGCKNTPVGGATSMLILDDWPIPVFAYLDLRNAESGPWCEDEEGYDGRIVVRLTDDGPRAFMSTELDDELEKVVPF